MVPYDCGRMTQVLSTYQSFKRRALCHTALWHTGCEKGAQKVPMSSFVNKKCGFWKRGGSTPRHKTNTCRTKFLDVYANACGACIRTRPNTGKYLRGIIVRMLAKFLREFISVWIHVAPVFAPVLIQEKVLANYVCIGFVPGGIAYPRNFPRSYRAISAGPTPLAPTPSEHLPPDLIQTWFWPDSDLKSAFSGPNQIEIRSEIRSKSGPNQVWGEVFGGGWGQRGRSSWNGSVAPRKVSSLSSFLSVFVDVGKRGGVWGRWGGGKSAFLLKIERVALFAEERY